MWECWLQAFDHSGTSPPTAPSDKDMLDEVVRGAQELCFNNQSTSLIDAYAWLIRYLPGPGANIHTHVTELQGVLYSRQVTGLEAPKSLHSRMPHP